MRRGWDNLGHLVQLGWIVILWWALPFGIFYGLYPEEGYDMLFENQTLGLELSFGSFALLVLSCLSTILINWGDAQQDQPIIRFYYALVLPLYPLYTTVRSIIWWFNLFRTVR
ncbi:hypothetical protein COT52_00305 [candidate division WWE3 bacterium CG08_land_8_20_14_0_20_43_13]|uniref:Uncharacterized protein n=1 Tax=candidate division WWE3 bacterium CG08_land_8_20_14_0_20_43_13 TaxID=1975087 RepID=A0A2H0X807_UNCKA|nr:MAG: hypothetical protein COT52_00305 [candidate division WWE3 bacterium CG08_land_8_20_14_0_20_43_13]